MIEMAVRDRLINDATLGPLIGQRVYPLVLPHNAALPAIVYQRISTPRITNQQGSSGLARPRLQLKSWATTFEAAYAVADAVRRSLDGFRGSLGSASGNIGGVAIRSDNEFADYDPDMQLHCILQDYLIWHNEEA